MSKKAQKILDKYGWKKALKYGYLKFSGTSTKVVMKPTKKGSKLKNL